MDEQERAREALKQMFAKDRERHDAELARQRAREAAEPQILRRIPGWMNGRLVILLVILLVIGLFGLAAGTYVVTRASLVDSVRQYCTAQSDGDYATAYQFLSSRVQHQLALTDYEVASQRANVQECQVAINAIRVAIDGDTATVPAEYQVGTSGGVQVDDAGTMRLVRENGRWKLDHLSSTLFSLF